MSADRLDLHLRPIYFHAKGSGLFLHNIHGQDTQIHTLCISVSSATSSAKSRSEKDSDPSEMPTCPLCTVSKNISKAQGINVSQCADLCDLRSDPQVIERCSVQWYNLGRLYCWF